ncbi:MAG: RNA polymerase sigma factor (sigma-70 family) [Chlamydiales bacterium]|jgi:RNA polymerase sigma factor (sigma-70 family)
MRTNKGPHRTLDPQLRPARPICPPVNPITATFVSRLRSRDPAAWFELWETFAPILRAQLSRWGRGRIGQETVKDLSQETMAALAGAIDKHDPARGARFSTWLLAIARYTLSDEMDRRSALKRGSGVRPQSLDEGLGAVDGGLRPEAAYERSVFDAKIEAALRELEREAGFMEFSVFRMRVLEGRSGRETAESLGVSEPTVSRRLAALRKQLRAHLHEVFSKYSFTDQEFHELERNGVELNPNKAEDGTFDEAIAEIYHRHGAAAEAETSEHGGCDHG